jgi:hypothetical protein
MVLPLPTKLTLDLDRITLGSGYFLHTSVVTGDPTKTNPPELEPSLLVKLSTTSQPDMLARVCTRLDLEEYSEPSAPYFLGLYELAGPSIASAIGSIQVGDAVNISCPDIWAYLGYGATFVTTVVDFPPSGDSVLVAAQMPSYFNGLSYTISLGVIVHASGADAIARRYNINGNPNLYVRVPDDVTCFTDLSQAIAKLNAVRAEAQGLVDDYDRDGTEFEGYSEEGYSPT